MKLKSALACTFAAMAVAGGAAGTAQAAEDDTSKIDNSMQIVSCDTIEVIDIPIASAANNTVDCSDYISDKESKSVHIVDEENAHATSLLLKRLR
ncbi:hypothetical protein RND61_12335 [Streptomyces sp. TRM76323]|uniref:Secreted protein n=1 Tax=Streptomyces tamarix TaxID=3078565 RepID=A0ABU3QJ98_9ACTN|nr:hypothetical protein [Streptomyces tamarix]MDT9682853.1 hypothetical protein [Streptomyces tamarix]